MVNNGLSKVLLEIADLLDIRETSFRSRAYRNAAAIINKLDKDISTLYKEGGIEALEKIPGVGKSISKKIEEYLKKKKIKYLEELREETAIKQIITHYFYTKDLSLAQLKRNAKKRKIIYSRFTKPAKQLLELAGSIEKAKEAITKVAEWAKTRNLDYAIETVFKKWLELNKLKPKEVVKKPYFRGNQMVWSEMKKKWYVISPEGEWLEFAGRENEIEWRIAQ